MVEIRQVAKPQPQAGEVLVEVHASTVTRTDCGMRAPHPWFVRLGAGLLRPKRTVPGTDFAAWWKRWAPTSPCGMPASASSASRPRFTARTPDTFVCPQRGRWRGWLRAQRFTNAWWARAPVRRHLSKEFGLRPGRRILVYGASGAIGSAAVQLAKTSGASVTALVSTRHLELARTLGADLVVDYSAEDFTRIGETFDAYRYVETGEKTGIVVIDVGGLNVSSASRSKTGAILVGALAVGYGSA